MGKPTALGANIFAGLFTIGVKQAGFDVLEHFEHGPYGVATAELNFPGMPVRVGRENWDEKRLKGKVDFMFCNPPCAAWSNAAQKGGSQQARRDWDTQLDRLRYVYDCAEAGIAIKPEAWCWESVTQAWVKGNSFVTQIAEMWCDVGYHCTLLLQNNKYLGAPQERKRMFLIAHRRPLVWPDLEEPRTVEDVLKRVPKSKYPIASDRTEMTPYHKRLWKLSAKHGGNIRKTFDAEGRGGLEGGTPSVLYRRVDLDAPAPVMLSNLKRCHPTQARYFDWSEWLALCGVPPDFKTSCRAKEAGTQELARAVLPPVGKWLARAVLGGLKKPVLRTRPSMTLVNATSDTRTEQRLWEYDGPTVEHKIPPPLPPIGTPLPKRAPGTPRVSAGPSKPGSGQRIREMLKKGWTADKILEVVHKEFPQSKATKSDVSWNKGKLRKEEGWQG